MNGLMNFINFAKKRPSDTTISIGRILFGIILISSLYYNFFIQGDSISSNYFWIDVPKEFLVYIKYFFIGIGIIPLIMGLTKICLLKKKWIKIVQIIFGILLFYISSHIITKNPNELDIDVLIGFIGILPLFAGITGKCITSKCLKYKEKITKIRV